MVPLLKKEKDLKQLIETLQKEIEPLSIDVLHRKKTFNPLISACIACNEIAGVGLHRIDGEFKCVPLMIEGYIEYHKEIYQKIFGRCDITYDFCEVKVKFHHRSYWTYEDMMQLQLIIEMMHDPLEIIEKTLVIARRILERSPYHLAVVCGPISTGGRSVEENLDIFNRCVYRLSKQTPLFNQMPFEPVFHKVHQLIEKDPVLCPNGKSTHFFIDRFYRSIFTDLKIWYPHFIHGWEESIGARAEHALFTKLGSKAGYLDEHYHLF
jgi:hypothetical protein